MSPLLNYLIAGLMVGYYALVWFTMIIYFNTPVGQVPKRKEKPYPIYMHGLVWFHIHWIAIAVAFGGLLIRWIAFNLGGL